LGKKKKKKKKIKKKKKNKNSFCGKTEENYKIEKKDKMCRDKRGSKKRRYGIKEHRSRATREK